MARKRKYPFRVTPEPIKQYIIVGAGYLQDRGNAEQGMPALAHRLHSRFASATCRVEFCSWNENWDSLAEWIYRTSAGGPAPTIITAFYSWCVGFGLKQFYPSLGYRGLRVRAHVSSDGVYHLDGPIGHRIGASQVAAYIPRFKPWRWLWRQSATCRPVIEVPRIVDESHWFVQNNFRWLDRMTWLRGHQLVWEDTREEVPGRVDIHGTTHRWMDELEPFQSRVFEVCERLIG